MGRAAIGSRVLGMLWGAVATPPKKARTRARRGFGSAQGRPFGAERMAMPKPVHLRKHWHGRVYRTLPADPGLPEGLRVAGVAALVPCHRRASLAVGPALGHARAARGLPPQP